MRYLIVMLLFTSICEAKLPPKFRNGVIVSVARDKNAFDNDALFYNCDKVKYFRVVSYVRMPEFPDDWYYVITPTTSDDCQFGAKVHQDYLKENR